MYIATYAVRAFLPIYALSEGVNILVVGSFFSIQEAVHLMARPWCGRFGDRFGYPSAIVLGLFSLSISLPALTYSHNGLVLCAISMMIGLAEALLSPSTIAMVAVEANPDHVGASMGIVGTLRNLGKVIGPILAGALIRWFDYSGAFHLIGGIVLVSALALMIGQNRYAIGLKISHTQFGSRGS
ncbi:MFS transporter [Chloroflexi bacterium TSY]|nr:MFS transporter [Chloroflexi bacterium TSY]